MRVAAVKLMADGALGSRGAALHAPYCDDPENRGLLLLPFDELEARARAAAERGFQVCVHAIGDRANTLVLDALESVLAGRPSAAGGRLAARPGADPRHRVEHAQILAAADIPRFRALGVLPSMQPTHCTSDMPWADARLGAERLAGAYAWRSLLRTGTVIAGGSDFPVELPNPFHGIHAAITRRPRDGPDPGWQPEQRMTRRGGRARVHQLERVRRAPGGRAGHARAREVGRPDRLLGGRLRRARRWRSRRSRRS